jgi:hypothetical protein
MAGLAPSLDRLVHTAREAPQLFLPRVEPHPAGMWVGLASVALGVWAAAADAGPVIGWVALCGVFVGMLLHARLRRVAAGWQVDFAARTVTPNGLPGEAVSVGGDGWSVACAPGERRSAMAIDLRHADRGRVARLYDSGPYLRGRRMRQLDELADVLARRLQVARSGPRL